MINLLNWIIKLICWLFAAITIGNTSLVISIILWDRYYFEHGNDMLDHIFNRKDE